MRKVKNIIFVGLYDDDNLGDEVIYKCTKYLYSKYSIDVKYESRSLSLLNPPIGDIIPNIIKRGAYKLRKILGAIFFKRNYFSATTMQKLWDIQQYYYGAIQGADLIIVAGGGLIKYRYQFCCWGSLSVLLRAANKRNIPVWLNAVGVEGYDEKENSCRYLKESLHLPCVKKISVRDDISTLIDKYFDGKPQCECRKVADTAVYAGEAYNNQKLNNSQIIGIGIGDEFLFFGRDEINHPINHREFYIDLIKRLLAEQQKIILFNNGAKEDNKTAIEIFNIFRFAGKSIELKMPESDEQLIEIIAKCRGIIAARLHSCIIAYSLDIPCVGMVWNEEVAFFGKNIGYPNRFLRDYEMQPENALKQIKIALKVGYNETKRDEYRKTIIDNIKMNVEEL